ncbi:hypothetical protein [Robinsoniella sp. KNHs210]|uniref:hypothetical protein n=1 Tax=Robinsoniella sp. KNHs210 TaxID=1469950 RepID=UPI000485114B|nr:hypothetical protein [Robinsoniella sp. KNHs210]
MEESIVASERSLSKEDLNSLVGYLITRIAEGMSDDGTDYVVMDLYNIETKLTMVLALDENGEIHLSEPRGRW